MKQLAYDILSRIPFYGPRFRRKHEPLFIYSNFFFDEPGSITRKELFELIDEYRGRHPDEAITTEVVNELLGAWEGKMQRTVDDLAILFNRIERGEATEEERADYDLGIKISCIREDVLQVLIRDRAEELRGE